MSDPACERFRELASAVADESLEGAELLDFEEHIERCGECRRFEAGLRRFRQTLRAAASVQPLRRPPAGFAAGVAARLEREAAASAVAFPAHLPRRRAVRALAGLAAAAAAALFFAWSWKRVLPGEDPAQRVAGSIVAPAVQRVVAPDEGSMDSWLRQHAILARDATLLGSAEEVEFASFRPAEPGR